MLDTSRHGSAGIVLVRCAAVLFGSAMLLMGAFDVVTGALDSEPQSLPERLRSAAPTIVMSCALIWPYRSVHTRWLFWTLATVLVAAAMWSFLLIPDSFSGYRQGRKSWHIIPVSIGAAGLFAANAVALVAVHARTRARSPGRSLEPTDS